MLRRFFLVLGLLAIFACEKSAESNLTLTGSINGIKEGTLYLQKLQDTSLVTLDSIVFEGNDNFTLKTFIEEPELLYLHLNKKDANDYNDRLSIFAEPGAMQLHTTLRRFTKDARISGSKNQKKMEEFYAIISKFNTQDLKLAVANYNAQQEENTETVAEINEKISNYTKSRLRYILNYAFTNKDLESTPYFVLTEASDANITYLDTIYKTLTPRIADSTKYGKKLADLIAKRKAEQQ